MKLSLHLQTPLAFLSLQAILVRLTHAWGEYVGNVQSSQLVDVVLVGA
jgi:hypothetical protein